MKRLVIGTVVMLGLAAIALLTLQETLTRAKTPLQPRDVAQCADADRVLFVHGKYPLVALASYDTGPGTWRDIYKGPISEVAVAPVGCRIAIHLLKEHAQPELLVLDGRTGTIIGRFSHPGYWASKPLWSADGQRVFVECDRPGITDEETGGMITTALCVADLRLSRVSWVPIGENRLAGQVTYSPTMRRLLASGLLNENDGTPDVDLYDEELKKVGHDSQLRGTIFSATAKYHIPHLHEGGLPWEIYNRDENPVARFSSGDCDKGRADTGYGPWNPANDNLLMIWTGGCERDRSSWQLYDVAERRVVKRLGTTEPTWSADGKALIFWREGKFIFQSVAP